MKVAQLLRENDDPETFHVTKRSEINRAVAAMGMADTIDFTMETDNLRHPNYSTDQIDEDYAALRAIIKKHTKRKVSTLGSNFMSSGFDSRKQLEQLKACLDEIADYFDPEKKDLVWGWRVGVSDDAWLYT